MWGKEAGSMTARTKKEEHKMNFILDCDIMDGLVLIDKSRLKELDFDLLCSFEILLDEFGKSELIYDFPGEEWETVRARETKLIKEFCEKGNMIVWLYSGVTCEGNIEKRREIPELSEILYLPSGTLLAVTASELIQCLFYPELEMEEIFEMELKAGRYAIWTEGIGNVRYCRVES